MAELLLSHGCRVLSISNQIQLQKFSIPEPAFSKTLYLSPLSARWVNCPGGLYQVLCVSFVQCWPMSPAGMAAPRTSCGAAELTGCTAASLLLFGLDGDEQSSATASCFPSSVLAGSCASCSTFTAGPSAPQASSAAGAEEHSRWLRGCPADSAGREDWSGQCQALAGTTLPCFSTARECGHAQDSAHLVQA